MNPQSKAREFWIDDILNVDRPSEKTAYVHEQDTEKSDHHQKQIHVIEKSAYDKAVEALKWIKEEWCIEGCECKSCETLRELGVEA